MDLWSKKANDLTYSDNNPVTSAHTHFMMRLLKTSADKKLHMGKPSPVA